MTHIFFLEAAESILTFQNERRVSRGWEKGANARLKRGLDPEVRDARDNEDQNRGPQRECAQHSRQGSDGLPRLSGALAGPGILRDRALAGPAGLRDRALAGPAGPRDGALSGPASLRDRGLGSRLIRLHLSRLRPPQSPPLNAHNFGWPLPLPPSLPLSPSPPPSWGFSSHSHFLGVRNSRACLPSLS